MKQGVGHLACDHVNFIAIGYCKYHISIFCTGLFKHRRIRCYAYDCLQIVFFIQLSEAHGMGIIHRDIKPGNIMLTQQGGEPDVAKVVDFGLVKDMESDPDPAVSQADAVVGTPRYMSPETIIAYHQVDARSDLYSLGAVAYFLLTGEHVFDGETAAEVVTHHIQTEPVPPSRHTKTEIPGDLEGVVMACLQKEPSRRPQSANHLRARLWACASRGKWNTDRARRWWKEHGDTVRARRDVYVDHPGDIGKTIAIDLGRHGR